MSQQNVKSFPIPGNEGWSAVARGPEWAYGHWTDTSTSVVFTRAWVDTEQAHHLLPGLRYPLTALAHRDAPISLLDGQRISIDAIRSLSQSITEWVEELLASHQTDMVHT